MKKIIFSSLVAFSVVLSCFSQINGDFVPLFNGKDLTNWKLDKKGGFEVIDGELVTKSFGSGYDIFTQKEYANFILRLEFFLSEVGNSGVFIRCKHADPGAGFEVQILAPWTPWRDDLHCTGSMYGYVAITNRPDETTGKWHKMLIKCDRNLITISVNDKVATFANTDTIKGFEKKSFTGVIGLQGNHAEKQGQYAKFRNISIRDLDDEPDYVLKGFYEKNNQLRNLAGIAAVNLGAKMIQPLADIMSGDDPGAKSEAKQALFDIVARATNPAGTEKDKKEVKTELKKSIKATSSEITNNYLKWLAGLIKN